MLLFNISFDNYLQYNLLFVFDSILILILYIYDNIYNIKIKGDRIENFIYYPYILIILIMLILKRSRNLKYDIMFYISEYLIILNTPYAMAYHGLKIEKE